MKKLLAILMFAACAVHAQFSNIDTTTIHASPTTNNEQIKISPLFPAFTNDTRINTNAFTVGDSIATTQSKMNYNWNWLATWLSTNAPWTGYTNFTLGGVVNGQSGANDFSAQGATEIISIVSGWAVTNTVGGGGGGGSGSNAVPIYSGGATNLTVTNTFTLTSTTPYYTIIGYNPTNIPPDTSVVVCSNRNGPYYLNETYGTGAMTNACGYVLFIDSLVAGGAQAVSYVNVTAGTGAGYYYTNYGFYSTGTKFQYPSIITVSGAGYSLLNSTYTNSDPGNPYWYSTTTNVARVFNNGPVNYDPQVFTNGSWISFYYTTNTPIWPADGSTYGSSAFTYYGSQHLPTPSIAFTNMTFGTYWTTWSTNSGQSNTWQFYFATNVVFNTNSTTTVVGTSLNPFYITNITQYPFTNYPYVDSLGYNVIFQGTNISYVPQDGNFFAIPPTNVAVVIYTPPPIPPPPNTNPPAPPWHPCDNAILYTVGTTTKQLTGGLSMWAQAINLNMLHPDASHLSSLTVSSDGTAVFILWGVLTQTIYWSDPLWSSNVDPYACNVLGKFPIGGGGGTYVYF